MLQRSLTGSTLFLWVGERHVSECAGHERDVLVGAVADDEGDAGVGTRGPAAEQRNQSPANQSRDPQVVLPDDSNLSQSDWVEKSADNAGRAAATVLPICRANCVLPLRRAKSTE